jgi:hypothetical protein
MEPRNYFLSTFASSRRIAPGLDDTVCYPAAVIICRSVYLRAREITISARLKYVLAPADSEGKACYLSRHEEALLTSRSGDLRPCRGLRMIDLTWGIAPSAPSPAAA